ncbi:sensor histidine kinase [Megamonas hypermegale]|uniref:sensor histidine kinase n=1 Tax=Megamonas hypermegale TaxID=158847 RepID=UPI0025A3FE5C|nr:sensor histidine kinase KdpD [Megamonas hypermegale]MDM8143925.1 sensor histidine kinase KdpD [Megamonas hypermegale]
MKNYRTSFQLQSNVPEKGHLKIFFGYAAGVGKTYAMLKAAHQAKKQGTDVVVGYIERHTRPDTLALLDGLEQIPVKKVMYKGIELNEFDLDGALKRHPKLLLVDELAHSNAVECRHTKRYQDVEELLRAGIDVYTTVNVQHLESLNDLIASITHITVNERIPDSIFDSADQVELVDIEPDDLIVRLHSGKVYQKSQAVRALNHFFQKDNLAALREIIMRRTADYLNRKAQKTENETAAKAGEHILTCLSSSPSNAKVIRTAARMAEAFHSGFTALFVETAEIKELKGDNLKRLRDNMRLAEQLGARIATVYGEDPAVQIAEYAKASGITKIVLGRTNHKTAPFMKSKTLIDRLIGLMENIDIYIIPDIQPLYKKRKTLLRNTKQEFNWHDLLKAILIIIAATGISFAFYEFGLREANIIIVYLLGVLLTAIWTSGYLYGILVSLLSVVFFNFFFTLPRFSLTAVDPNYPITFFVMLLASCISCSLATRVKRQARQSAQRAYYMELLMNSTQKIQQGRNEQEIIQIAAKQIETLLNRPILYALLEKNQQITFQVYPSSETKRIMKTMTTEELGIADWVAKNDKHAGATTNTLSHAQNLYLSVRGNQEVMAVVGIPLKFYPSLDTFEKNLLISILDSCGLVLERRKLRMEKQQAEIETQREQLRANLLRAISHDLRTPLTSISGNAGVLMEKSISLTENKKQEMYRSIYDDSMWLVNLTENLLSITRLENGTMHLNMRAELIDDVFREALSHVDRKSSEHDIVINLSNDMLMANMDVRLIVQVIINIINNAIKYTPVNSHICISAEKKGKMVEIQISDDGPGISDEAKQHLFDMFCTANTENISTDSRRGLGLGLSLCKSIIEAHGGTILVSDNKPHGALFSFTLPLEEVQIQNV